MSVRHTIKHCNTFMLSITTPKTAELLLDDSLLRDITPSPETERGSVYNRL